MFCAGVTDLYGRGGNGGGAEPALAGRRVVVARTGAGGRLGSCLRRNDGKERRALFGDLFLGGGLGWGCIW